MLPHFSVEKVAVLQPLAAIYESLGGLRSAADEAEQGADVDSTPAAAEDAEDARARTVRGRWTDLNRVCGRGSGDTHNSYQHRVYTWGAK